MKLKKILNACYCLVLISFGFAVVANVQAFEANPPQKISSPPEAPQNAFPPDEPISDQESFQKWLQANVLPVALDQGMKKEFLDKIFPQLKFIPKVIQLDRKQPEFTMTLQKYLKYVVSKERVAIGKKNYRQYSALIHKASKEYKVQPQYIVALWGIESYYGKRQGTYPVISSLASLAHNGRRQEFFTKELLNALKIIEQGHISYEKMIGSWAGAMGQNQFMPSTFLNYAKDGNSDGKKDIWTNRQDVFSSTAFYLSDHGWIHGERWGRAVKISKKIPDDIYGLEIKKSLKEWQALGVKLRNGKDLPNVDMKASLITPDGRSGPAYLVYHNFSVFLKWNRSLYFAIAVGHLADSIAH